MRYKLLAITILFILSASTASASDCVIKGATFCNGPDYAPALFPTNSDTCGSAGSAAQDNQTVVCCCPVNTIQVNNGQITSSSTGAITASSASNNPEKKPFDILNPLENLQVKISGLDAISEKYPATCNDDNGPTTCQLPFIAIYITALYNYAMGAIGILAAIALMIGGMLWLVSAGNATRITQAKNWIGGAITGILIMSTSYILLNEINPELIGLKSINLEIVEEFEDNTDPVDISSLPATSLDNNNWITIPNNPNIVNNLSSDQKKANPATVNALSPVAKCMADKGYKMSLRSGSRTVAGQAAIYDNRYTHEPNKCGTKNYGQDAACCPYPLGQKICPHTSGSAFDAWGLANNNKDFKAQIALQDCMWDNGFCLLSNLECWHFEMPQISKSACTYNRTYSLKGGYCSGLKIACINAGYCDKNGNIIKYP